MSISKIYKELRQIALAEFQDVVLSVEILEFPSGDPHKVRLDIADGSLLDIFLSISGRYSYHWDRRLAGTNKIYRHDNAPHLRWRAVSTFPKHFHDGSEDNVTDSFLNESPPLALRQNLTFVRQTLLSEA